MQYMPNLHTTQGAKGPAEQHANNNKIQTIHVRKIKSIFLRQFVEWATLNVLLIERCT
jgi:hypothetical protein